MTDDMLVISTELRLRYHHVRENRRMTRKRFQQFPAFGPVFGPMIWNTCNLAINFDLTIYASSYRAIDTHHQIRPSGASRVTRSRCTFCQFEIMVLSQNKLSGNVHATQNVL